MRISDLLNDDDVIDATVVDDDTLTLETTAALAAPNPVRDDTIATLDAARALGSFAPTASPGPVAAPAPQLPRWCTSEPAAPAALVAPTPAIAPPAAELVVEAEPAVAEAEAAGAAPEAAAQPPAPRRFAIEQWLEWTGQSDAPTRRPIPEPVEPAATAATAAATPATTPAATPAANDMTNTTVANLDAFFGSTPTPESSVVPPAAEPVVAVAPESTQPVAPQATRPDANASIAAAAPLPAIVPDRLPAPTEDSDRVAAEFWGANDDLLPRRAPRRSRFGRRS
ncbi:MAG: hypothetical protein ACOYNI_05680 [Acidimicrobiia bacterium]